MMNKAQHRCLYCYHVLAETDQDFHAACSKKIFGTGTPVLLPYHLDQLEELSKEVTLPGNDLRNLQVRFSLDIEKKATQESNKSFAIVGLAGHYILKAPTSDYPSIVELEDLTMHLAAIAQIKTATHSLIRLQSGELAFISQRMDRTKKGKLPMEDMCQLTETLTEDQYQGSMENIGKVLHAYSSNPGLDVISLFELTLFCYLTGNADMHLKNFALLTNKENETGLAPAYHLVSTRLLFPEGKEEMALSVNGKKRNLRRSDFDALAGKLKINAKTLDNTYKRFQKNLLQMLTFIDISFLNEEMKKNYKDLIKKRFQVLLGIQDASTDQQEDELIEESPEVISAGQEEDFIKVSTENRSEKQEEVVINKSTGEIYTRENGGPNSRQLSLF